MGGCCSNRDTGLSHTNIDLLHYKTQLTQSKEKLTLTHRNLQKLNMHLSHFHQRAADFRILLRELQRAKDSYVEQHSKLAESVDQMNSLLSQLDTEVQAQYISERESSDLTKDELYSVIQAVRAEKQADRLEQLAGNLQTLITYPEKRKEFDDRVQNTLNSLRLTCTSLLGYIRFVNEAKKAVYAEVEGLRDPPDVSGNEKIQESAHEWNILRRAIIKLTDDLESFSHKLISAFQKIEEQLRKLQQEVDSFLEAETQTNRAVEVHSAAQQYITLISTGRASVPRKSRKSSGIPSPMLPNSHSGSVYMEEFAGSLRRFCILNHYRDGEVSSPTETYAKLVELLVSKAAADTAAREAQESPLPLEMFLLMHFTKGEVDKSEAVKSIAKFTGGLDQLATYPLAALVLEMLKFLEMDAMSIHEEVFIAKAFSQLEAKVTEEAISIDIDQKWRTGGVMSLQVVISLVEQWFQDNPNTGEIVVAGLLPTVPLVEVAVYYILFRLAQRRMTSEELFYLLDKRKANNIHCSDFIQGAKEHLGIMLPESYLRAVSEVMDKTASNGIFRTEFNELLRPATLLEMTASPTFTVSRMAVITSLRNAYKEWKSELSSQLYMDFILVPINDYRVSIADAETLVQALDPDLTPSQFSAYKSRLRTFSSENFSFEAFRDCVFQFPVGASAKSFFSIVHTAVEGLAWASDKVKVTEFVCSLLRGKKSLVEVGARV